MTDVNFSILLHIHNRHVGPIIKGTSHMTNNLMINFSNLCVGQNYDSNLSSVCCVCWLQLGMFMNTNATCIADTVDSDSSVSNMLCPWRC